MAEDYNLPKGALMAGKKGLVMGVANHNSIAWGIAAQLAAQGADIALAYMESNEKRVRPLGESIGAKAYTTFDASSDESMEAAFKVVEDSFGEIDFLVHAIAFAPRDQIKGSFVENATREGFAMAMDISAYSFVDAARRASRLMPNGGSMITLTYLGSERAIPNYNTMGVAKAALEAATRYIARDLGPKGIRVNALAPGTVNTDMVRNNSPEMQDLMASAAIMNRLADPEEMVGPALLLTSDAGSFITGQVLLADGGMVPH
jgi:enoyl-[acyl-carrier protein] reductase I